MKKIFILLFTAIAFSSCEKDLVVDEPTFDVTTEKLTYRVGEPVVFNFAGQANNISFYSGVGGSEYQYRNRIEVEGGKPRFRFTTQYGGGGTQQNTLKVLVTTELAGSTKEGVLATQWTDVTSRVTLATNATLTQSGIVDLSDIAVPGKPIYIAYRYESQKDPARAAGTWVIANFVAETLLPNGSSIPVSTLLTAGWVPFSIRNDATNWSTRANYPDLLIQGGGANAEPSEDYYVSAALYFTKVPPDAGLALQNIGSNALSSYSYTYTKAGTYDVTFMASNTTVDDQKSVLRHLKIVVTE